MQITCDAIVLSVSKYGENSGIVCIFTEQHGIYKGLVRGISGVRQRGLYQPGNIIEATWRARLAEHLGNITAGLLCPSATAIMDNPLKLAALSSICALLESALQERDAAPGIYHSCKDFLDRLANDGAEWQKCYVLLELELLAQLGFGLDLGTCVATGGQEDLIYVSPKSGRAVCREAGRPYADKMLKLPEFLAAPASGGAAATGSQIYDGIRLCSYFLDKYFFAPHNISQPQARARFTAMLARTCP